MVTLSRFIKPQPSSEDASYVRAISLLLQGIELHTLEHNQDDYDGLQADLSAIQRGLFPKMPIPEIFTLVGKAIKALEEYSRRSAGRLRAQFSELQSINVTLSRAIEAMVSTSETSLARLHEIQSQLSAAERMDDLRLVKKHLCECLHDMAAEVEQHKTSSQSVTAGLAGPQVTLDPVTGLPARVEAEAALSKIVDSGIPAVAVVLTLKRLKHVNSRYGYGAGDSLLARLANYLQSGVSVEEGPYRWRGPALIAIITKDAYFDRIRHEIRRLVTDMPQFEIAIGGRTVAILPSVGWIVSPVTRPLDKLVRELEEFVVHQSAEGA